MTGCLCAEYQEERWEQAGFDLGRRMNSEGCARNTMSRLMSDMFGIDLPSTGCRFVEPRWGSWLYFLTYPACAARRWALELNRVAVVEGGDEG